MNDIMVSITELEEFARCRRKWDFISPHRQGLRKNGYPNLDLHIGTGVHKGMEAGLEGRDPVKEVEEWADGEIRKISAEYREVVGTGLSSSETAELLESHRLVRGMVEHYYLHYGDSDTLKPFKVLATELSFRIPFDVPTRNNGVVRVYLVGTVDGVLEGPGGGIWLLEHKSYRRETELRWLRVHQQMVGYCFSLGFLLKEKVRGVVYNGLRKKLPRRPSVLKSNGMLSLSAIDTTRVVYEDTISEHHGAEWRKDPALVTHYEGCLRRLDTREREVPFFVRHRISFTSHQVEGWGKRTFEMLTEMMDDPRLFPSFRGNGCPDCRVSDLCIAQEMYGNEDRVRDRFYVKGEYRPQYGEMTVVEPSTVGSVGDLVRVVGSWG